MKDIMSAQHKRGFHASPSGQVLRGQDTRPAGTGVLSCLPDPLTFRHDLHIDVRKSETHVLMPQMLQQLQLSVSPLAQNGSREGLHNLLDGDSGTSELILGGTDGFEGEDMMTRQNGIDVRMVVNE